MEPTDLTIRILQEIRDEQRATRTELKAEIREVNDRLGTFNARFEVVETALRDMAEQLVMLARGIKSALEARSDVDRRISDCERRLDLLEKPSH